MIRLLLRLFGIRDYENCKSCETYKAQLEYVNQEKKELLETILSLTRPTVIIPQGETKILTQAPQAKGTFTRKRGILEEMHKKTDHIVRNSPFIAKPGEDVKKNIDPISPQAIESLERELGLEDKENVG